MCKIALFSGAAFRALAAAPGIGSTWRGDPTEKRGSNSIRSYSPSCGGKLEIVAARCMERGGIVVIEWPRRCEYWRDRRVEKFLADHNMSSHDFDGCQYGIVSIKRGQEGVPIRKPWRIATNSDAFGCIFSCVCVMERIIVPNARGSMPRQRRDIPKGW